MKLIRCPSLESWAMPILRTQINQGFVNGRDYVQNKDK